jgi:hypothetical protein
MGGPGRREKVAEVETYRCQLRFLGEHLFLDRHLERTHGGHTQPTDEVFGGFGGRRHHRGLNKRLGRRTRLAPFAFSGVELKFFVAVTNFVAKQTWQPWFSGLIGVLEAFVAGQVGGGGVLVGAKGADKHLGHLDG